MDLLLALLTGRVATLGDELAFPPPEAALPSGVVAVGGDTSPQRLLLAYSRGIFPWPHERLPLLWYSPDPRFVLPLDAVHVGRTLRRTVRAGTYRITADTAFDEVVAACARTPRPDQDGTWITDELRAGFGALHERGHAHSVEAWHDGRLVGGMYGIALGGVFCGESMFAHRPDASKVALVTALANLRRWGFTLLDCQVHTEHLERFGAMEWPRTDFLEALEDATRDPAEPGPWHLDLHGADALAELDR
ncbi:leucyl/phenylalanyl-tRNA--protein transferase [Pseudonocardia humida]|uniref:Leucyl/phenylalanyl-tRNA--protein transferase n=1 Tax=Pseudonocardia humida TaxID=2800819 RepID=A0ABT1A5X2_9PSEU|nr:leucyl/phenylalanyl-tRNA--protein transferase [Pseudonocardia humida]MCO1658402.1 leucyl/phenylalanyl-tRNA--protein transferase [Pseudonocardia humida]